MTDPRAVYFPKDFCKHGSLGYIMSGMIRIREKNISAIAYKQAHEKIMQTMPMWIDNLYCRYKPNLEYLAPFIIDCYLKCGINAVIYCVGAHKEFGTITLSFVHLPHITHVISNLDTRNDMYLGINGLQQKLIETYLTPYVEEAYTLELLPQVLPQPIAEAIADCIMGVIARRRHNDGRPPLVADWQTAWDHEVILTYVDMFGTWPRDKRLIPAEDSWEATAKKMILDEGW